MWNRLDIDIQLLQDNFQFLHVSITENGANPWLLTAVYASPRENERTDTWNSLVNLASSINEPWLMLGDFNDIASPMEQKGGANPDVQKCLRFANWINDCGLMEVTTIGSKYTWRGPKWEGHDRVFKKLDRVLCNVEWRLRNQEAVAKVLPRIQSDHHPILVLMEGFPEPVADRPFRFESAWTTHPEFYDFLKSNWMESGSLASMLGNLTPELKRWNHDIFGNIFQRKKILLARLNGVQNSPRYGYSKFLENLENELQHQLTTTLYQEECLWYQKSRGKWIDDGDRNTKYYHSKTIVRRKKNKIHTLRDTNLVWEEDPVRLKDLVRRFFVDLFCETTQNRDEVVAWASYPSILENHGVSLSAKPQREEIKRALFEMGAHKSPGEDGFPALFYQQYWEMAAPSLMNFVEHIWEDPAGIAEVNNTLLVLIPKVDKPEFVSQFRPISLCNVTYKLITKIIVNRIKPFLNDLISPYQSSFIPGRTIHHNIIIAQEMVHAMHKMKGSKMFMTIKIDLEKAYDRLNWSFIIQCLKDCKFPNELINIINHCLTSSTFKILWNGGKTDVFTPSRGVRQGDPISPYLFVICMERLSHIIADQVEAGYWKAMRAGRTGPQISHLLFADDLLLFAEASVEQAHCIMHCLDSFCQASGQKINDQKTQVFFSKNVDQPLRQEILQHTGFLEATTMGRYLGANIAHGRTTRGHYRHIIDKIHSRLSGWKHQCLSLAGRVTLTQSVLSSIPYFHMQYTKLPTGICDEIERIQRRFVWGDTEERRRPHLVHWKTCCLPRQIGGLGIKKSRQMNDAFLMKMLWNLTTKPQDLWCQVLHSKYGRNQDLLKDMIVQPYDSPLWKALKSVWNAFVSNLVWKVGDGKQVNFWMDRWIPNKQVLFNNVLDGTNIIDITLSVNDITRDNGKWNAEFLNHYLPTNIVNIINAIPPPLEDDGLDSIGWNGTNDYEFSTKSAYITLCGDRPGVDGDWRGLWKWKGPHRIQTFMWLAAHGRLLTNERRHRWNSSISAQCPLCNQNDETLMHVLRDCMYATRVWLKIIPSPRVVQFFDTVDRDWVFDNISSAWLLTEGAPWHSVYMVTCWFLWNWRNRSIFERNFERPHNEVAVILKYVTDITNSTIMPHQRQHIDTVMVRWKPPDVGWIKLNCDGACKLDLRKAGCGGLLRDSFGRWVRGFAYRIGDCTALQAEMWGMWLGMQLAKSMGFTNLIIESDSKVLVDLITSVSANSGESYKLIKRMQRLLSSDWHVRVIHVWREGNRCADWLANYGLQLDSNDMVELEHPPRELQQILFDDLSGASMPRNIRVVD